MASKNKLIRYQSIEVEDVFSKEDELIKLVQTDQLSQVLLLWQVKSPTLVLPAGKKWPISDELEQGLEDTNWKLFSRKTGAHQSRKSRGSLISHIFTIGQKISHTTLRKHTLICVPCSPSSLSSLV